MTPARHEVCSLKPECWRGWVMDSVIVTLVTLKWEESGHVSTCVFVLLQREGVYGKPSRGVAEFVFWMQVSRLVSRQKPP